MGKYTFYTLTTITSYTSWDLIREKNCDRNSKFCNIILIFHIVL